MIFRFLQIPIRDYQVATPAWWNSLRDAGIAIEQWLGTYITETLFSIANNQVAPSDITGLAFDPTKIGGFTIDYRVYRNTTGGGATELAEQGQLVGAYSPVAGTWEMTEGPDVGDAGIDFSITNAGQVQYTSTNISGTPANSYIRFKARSTAL